MLRACLVICILFVLVSCGDKSNKNRVVKDEAGKVLYEIYEKKINSLYRYEFWESKDEAKMVVYPPLSAQLVKAHKDKWLLYYDGNVVYTDTALSVIYTIERIVKQNLIVTDADSARLEVKFMLYNDTLYTKHKFEEGVLKSSTFAGDSLNIKP